MQPDRLVHMANQIGRFFASQPGDASAAIADHLRQFWDPRMRAEIVAYVQADGDGLDPATATAVRRLAVPGSADEGR